MWWRLVQETTGLGRLDCCTVNTLPSPEASRCSKKKKNTAGVKLLEQVIWTFVVFCGGLKKPTQHYYELLNYKEQKPDQGKLCCNTQGCQITEAKRQFKWSGFQHHPSTGRCLSGCDLKKKNTEKEKQLLNDTANLKLHSFRDRLFSFVWHNFGVKMTQAPIIEDIVSVRHKTRAPPKPLP